MGVFGLICNKDCPHCPYPDCINDELTAEEYLIDEVGPYVNDKPTKRVVKDRIRSRNRMRRIRAEDKDYDKKYYWTHREQEIQRNAEAKKNNPGYYNAYQRERYAKNREEMCRKQREYRARKKANAV